MHYSDFQNQAINLARFGAAVLLVYVLWPLVLFRDKNDDILGGLVAGYVKMVCLTTAVVFFLVLTKLYDIYSLAAILILATLYNNAPKGNIGSQLASAGHRAYVVTLDFLDGLVSVREIVRRRALDHALRGAGFLGDHFGGWLKAWRTLLLLAVLASSAYLRFYDAVRHAAPAMSDGYTDLAWIKYIEENTLFHDGIYPQGMPVYLSIIHKIGFNDALYALKYGGPLTGLLITLGIYFFVSRVSGRALGGIIAAFVYGVLGANLSAFWVRQTATNSQEFALIFLLPAWYFMHRYLVTSRREDLWSAASAFTVIAWVHTLVFGFLMLGVAAYGVIRLTLDFRSSLRPVRDLILAGGAAGFLGGVPAVIGLLMGQGFFSTSAEFLTASYQGSFPPFTILGDLALAGVGLYALSGLVRYRKHSRHDLALVLFVLLVTVSGFVLYEYLGPLSHNAVLGTRAGVLWSVLTATGIGFGFAALAGLPAAWYQAGMLLLASFGMAGAVFLFRPVPPNPYKMQYGSEVGQYLAISSGFSPTTWLLVATREDYALVLEKGYHLRLDDFLNWYSPADKQLARVLDGRREVLTTPDIFIVEQKRPFPEDASVQAIMKPIVEQRVKDYNLLDRWVKTYAATHDNLTVYYQDEDIIIYHIHQPQDKALENREIWGGTVSTGGLTGSAGNGPATGEGGI